MEKLNGKVHKGKMEKRIPLLSNEHGSKTRFENVYPNKPQDFWNNVI